MVATSLFTPTRSNHFGRSGRGLASARRWLPSDLTEVFCWLDAASFGDVLDAAGNPAANGENVDKWQSRVGTFSFENATDTQRPTFVDDGASANRRPYLSFDGTDDRLVYSGSFQAATVGEVFAVVRHDRESTTNGAFLGLGLSTQATPWLYHRLRSDSSGGVIRQLDDLSASVDSFNQWGRAKTVHLINIRSDGTNISIHKQQVAGNTPAAALWYGDITAHNRATIGGLTRTTFSLPWQGKVFELIFTDTVLSAADRARVNYYLAKKYGARFWAAIGDSITKKGEPGEWPNKMAAALQNTTLEANSFVEHAEASELTAAALTRWTNDVKGKGYDGVVLLSSINDVLADVATATSTANLQTILSEALDEGLYVVISTIMPFGNHASWTNSRQTLLDDLNAWIRAQAAGDVRIHLVEAHDNMGDTNPQDLLAAYDSGDGLHPSAAGDQAFADLLKTTLESLT